MPLTTIFVTLLHDICSCNLKTLGLKISLQLYKFAILDADVPEILERNIINIRVNCRIHGTVANDEDVFTLLYQWVCNFVKERFGARQKRFEGLCTFVRNVVSRIFEELVDVKLRMLKDVGLALIFAKTHLAETVIDDDWDVAILKEEICGLTCANKWRNVADVDIDIFVFCCCFDCHFAAHVVERNVCSALESVFKVPVGFAVAHHVEHCVFDPFVCVRVSTISQILADCA